MKLYEQENVDITYMDTRNDEHDQSGEEGWEFPDAWSRSLTSLHVNHLSRNNCSDRFVNKFPDIASSLLPIVYSKPGFNLCKLPVLRHKKKFF